MATVSDLVRILALSSRSLARIEWQGLIPDFGSPFWLRYIRATGTPASSVPCLDGRKTCYQTLLRNPVTGELRAVCNRTPERCARRTVSDKDAEALAFDVGVLCTDIAQSLGIVSKPVEESPGVWDCGKMRLAPGRYAGVRFVVVGEDPKGLLAATSLRFVGSVLIIPSMALVEQSDLAVIEARECRVFGLLEDCCISDKHFAVNDAAHWKDTITQVATRESGIESIFPPVLGKHLAVQSPDWKVFEYYDGKKRIRFETDRQQVANIIRAMYDLGAIGPQHE